MAVTVNGLSFRPLHWIHNDCWKWRIPSPLGDIIHNHYGHTHFFMLGFDFNAASADAFYGEMQYKFELKDIWGPRSSDPNQQFQYNVIGTPKWYFHIEEVWRRVYIQMWDHPDNDRNNPDFIGKRGIKYDASLPLQTFGPYREGRDFTPYFLHSARTLPLEYFTTSLKERDKRDNFVKEKWRAQPAGSTKRAYTDALYVPPEDGDVPTIGSPGGYPTFPDGLYIYPTLEYQKVVQLDWERPPGWQATHDKSPTDFGDGWSVELTVPFKNPVTNQYRSPFGPQPGLVSPPGQYHNNLVALDKQLKFRDREYVLPNPPSTTEGSYDYENRPFGMSEANSGKPLTFQNPYDRADGRWVQQCLGGIIQAKAEVTIESKLNNAGPAGYQKVWVHSTQYVPQDRFAGVDQKQGSAT
jgi:hypothetical protein